MAEAMRLDRFLWFARLAKSRTLAQSIAESGHLRIDGRAIDRAHATVRIGNVLTFAQGPRVRVLKVAGLPPRRGPAPEAQACYVDIAAADPPVDTRPDGPADKPANGAPQKRYD